MRPTLVGAATEPPPPDDGTQRTDRRGPRRHPETADVEQPRSSRSSRRPSSVVQKRRSTRLRSTSPRSGPDTVLGQRRVANIPSDASDEQRSRSLVEASRRPPVGHRRAMSCIRAGDRDVTSILGERIEGGPVDDAAWVSPATSPTRPGSLQSLRSRTSASGSIRRASSSTSSSTKPLGFRSVPTCQCCRFLICRRRSYATFMMSLDLGFYTFETNRQFVKPADDLTEEDVQEVRELFPDLLRCDTAHAPLVDLYMTLLPKHAKDVALKWQKVGGHLGDTSRNSGSTKPVRRSSRCVSNARIRQERVRAARVVASPSSRQPDWQRDMPRLTVSKRSAIPRRQPWTSTTDVPPRCREMAAGIL